MSFMARDFGGRITRGSATLIGPSGSRTRACCSMRFDWERADALRAADPHGVPRQDAIDLAQRPGKGLGEFAQPGDEVVGYVGHQAADARHAGGEPGAGPHLLEIVDALALLERPEKRR